MIASSMISRAIDCRAICMIATLAFLLSLSVARSLLLLLSLCTICVMDAVFSRQLQERACFKSLFQELVSRACFKMLLSSQLNGVST